MVGPGRPEPHRVETTILMRYVNAKGELHTMRIHCSEDASLAPWIAPDEVRETARLIAARVGAECEILPLQLKERPLRSAQRQPRRGAQVIDIGSRQRKADPGAAAKASPALCLLSAGLSEALAACCIYG